jgi:PRTRC genetic system protein D
MGNRCDAVDVGNGHTKFAIGANDRGHPIIKSMPSWAIKGSSSEVGNGAKDNVDLVNVGVGEQRFLVGKDSTLEVHRRDRVRTADFCMKDEYQALVSGALHYAGVNSDVDVLVLGLPVKRLNNYRADLEAKYSGIELSLPNGTVKVKEARVYAQPVGGLFLWGMEKGGDRMKRLLNERSLVIDPGHGTLDWLVTEGFKVIESQK